MEAVLNEFKRRMAMNIEDGSTTIINGRGIDTLEDYRYSIGYIKGQKDAIALLEQVLSEARSEQS